MNYGDWLCIGNHQAESRILRAVPLTECDFRLGGYLIQI